MRTPHFPSARWHVGVGDECRNTVLSLTSVQLRSITQVKRRKSRCLLLVMYTYMQIFFNINMFSKDLRILLWIIIQHDLERTYIYVVCIIQCTLHLWKFQKRGGCTLIGRCTHNKTITVYGHFRREVNIAFPTLVTPGHRN